MAYYNATLPALFSKTCRNYPNNEAIDGLSYSAVHDLVDNYTAGLRASGVARNDVVCSFFGQKTVDAPALALAVMRVGATHVPLASSDPERRLLDQCSGLGKALKLLVYGTQDADRSKAETVGGKMKIHIRPLQSVKAIIRDATDASSWDDLAIILFTSGSSGPPKATGYKHKQLVLSLQACAAAVDFSHTTRICNVIPYVWDGGNLDLFGPLLVGGAVCFAHDISPEGIARTIVSDKCTHIVAPPSLLHMVTIDALVRLEALISCGESASVAQFRNWNDQLGRRSNTRLFNAYGLTESGICNLIWECPEVFPPDLQSVPIGLPLPHTHVHIDEANGELIVSGPKIAEGYLGVASKAFIAPPSEYSPNCYAMRTGDSGWKDNQGQYHISGRLDDQLSIFSMRIEPEESETAALALPEIDIAHLFIHDLGEGQTPALALAYHVRGAPHHRELLGREEYDQFKYTYEKQLRQHMRESVPSHQCPSAYLPLGLIPRTISNKTDKRRIAALATAACEKGLVEFPPFSL